LVRREAYYTCLAGGLHGYDHNDSWRVKPRWRDSLDDPGATQMTVLKNIFTRPQAWQDAVLVVKAAASVQSGRSQARNFVGDEPDPWIQFRSQ